MDGKGATDAARRGAGRRRRRRRPPASGARPRQPRVHVDGGGVLPRLRPHAGADRRGAGRGPAGRRGGRHADHAGQGRRGPTRRRARDSVDVGFAQDMRVHHLQAVTMAGIERDRTSDPILRGLAFDIESTQLSQASEMAGWLTVWVQPDLPNAGAGHMKWMSEGGTHPTATATAVRPPAPSTACPAWRPPTRSTSCAQLTGKELDVLFLQLMLRHHEGGLEMAEYARRARGQGVRAQPGAARSSRARRTKRTRCAPSSPNAAPSPCRRNSRRSSASAEPTIGCATATRWR